MSHCIDITDNSFESEVLHADNLVLVDFWAPWCGPCKMIAPTLEEVSEHYGDKLKVVKINIDENSLIAQNYGVRGVPTLMLFKTGENIETKVGVIQKSQLISIIDRHL